MIAQLRVMHILLIVSASIKNRKKIRGLICIMLCTILLLPFGLTGCTDIISVVCERVNYDSDFQETIVRDHRDESYGALSNGSVRPLGGGEGYPRIVSRPQSENTPFEAVVNTADELREAMKLVIDLPRTIYVDDAVEIDLSYCEGCSDWHSGPENCDEYSLTIPRT